ncbi:DUF11 domain-containing protein [Sphingomonas bacterium]|uniref:DUF11 domain-containing protein n=1 Tax=Sphingomonas bacterium TaxID=1895847 RepID=UPI001576100B|nr:DUF11 domain-containing protein [Sphingomonas bacterium]
MTISTSTIRRSVAVGLVAVTMPAIAAAGPLQVTSSVMVEHRAAAADGTTHVALAKATKVAPGDRVIFVTTYTNTGKQPIADLVLADPIPASIAYRAPNPGSPAPEVSVDGRTYGTLATLRVALPAGGARAATADDVTAVRWRLSDALAPGAHGERAFRAILK